MHRSIPLFLGLLMITLAGAPRAEASPSSSGSPAASAHPRAKAAREAQGSVPARSLGHPNEPAASAHPRAKAAREAQGSVPAHSLGHPNDGRLEGGIRLDTSIEQLRVVPAYAGEDVRWGLPALVHMIERAARGVARRYSGAVLDVGDLSRRNGGEVYRHHSHESGRDADLGLYAVDAKGKQVHARSFIQFDARLAAVNVPGARLDVGRTWLLVQEMLTDPKARVSHLFIAEPLKRALLAEARRRGVSRAVLVRAQLAMMQPTGAEPHDDHLHVRISCPRDVSGCIELAKNAPSARDRARAARAERGAKALRTPARGAPQHSTGALGQSARGSDAPAKAQRKPHPGSEGARGAPRAAVAAPTPAAEATPPAARGIAQDPMRLKGIDLAILKVPGVSRVETKPEAEADGADVRDAIDDSGAVKITD